MCYINKLINNKNLYNGKIYKQHIELAKYNFMIYNNSVTINNIEVYYKNKGIGSYILKNIEKYVKNIYNINKINLCAWQKYGDNNLINFYQKNGYILKNENNKIYDDYIFLYELYEFEKNI